MFIYPTPRKANRRSYCIPMNAGIAAAALTIVRGLELSPSTGRCSREHTGRIKQPVKYYGIINNTQTTASFSFPTWAKQCQDLGYKPEVIDKVIKTWQDLIKKYTTQK
jgi:hypothetical protein